MDIAELKTESLKDLPKTVPLSWDYNNFCVGVSDPVSDIKYKDNKTPRSVTIEGNSQSGAILLGSVDPSHIWWGK